MSYTISKEFHFSASHVLQGLPVDHPCGRLHGHNYIVKLELHAHALDSTGFVFDYGRLKPFSDYIDRRLDHRSLNDTLTGNPTAENLARRLWRRAFSLFSEELPRGTRISVGVSETPKTWAYYEGRTVAVGPQLRAVAPLPAEPEPQS